MAIVPSKEALDRVRGWVQAIKVCFYLNILEVCPSICADAKPAILLSLTLLSSIIVCLLIMPTST